MTFLLALLGGIAGLIVGWVITAAATIFIGDLIGASNFEGALGMGAIFGLGPIGGLVGLIAGVWIAIWKRRARATKA
jgi:hypothetical protein